MSGKNRKKRDPKPIWDSDKLRQWRESRNMLQIDVARKLNVGCATYRRYENGRPPPLDMANEIVAMTRGKVRYRDMYWNFHPEYA